MIRKEAIKLIKQGKVKIETMTPQKVVISVDKDIVVLQKMPGRTMLSCSCENHARHINSICKHKSAAIFTFMMAGIK